MPYTTLATAQTPALIIYALDVSASMRTALGSKTRIEVVTDALGAALRQMVFRSTKGTRVAPRYRVAMFAYSDQIFDLLDGIKPVDIVANKGLPQLPTMRTTDTARAFAHIEQLLAQELPNLHGCPAPLICHMTDGEYTGDDPAPIVQRIRAMAVPDGPVLVENIFISDQIVPPIADPANWPGISSHTTLQSSYAKKLRELSSPLPSGYRDMMLESGMRMAEDALMLIPGSSAQLVELAFVMSTATPVAR
jgi:hypothetical protein